jgi:hypothetical protein
MTTVVTAPETTRAEGFKVYLAGAIDMGAAVDWQAQVIEALNDLPSLILFNPRRAHFTPDMETEQIEWELNAMDAADLIFLWFPKDARAPVSLFEAGLFMDSGKLLIGAEHGFYRRRNLELTCPRHGVPCVYSALDMMIGIVRTAVINPLG